MLQEEGYSQWALQALSYSSQLLCNGTIGVPMHRGKDEA